MPSRALPNLGLQAFFDPGDDGWDDEMSLNLLLLSVLVQGGVMETVSATPGAPADGDVYLFAGDHPTDPNKIAIRDDGAWVLVMPLEGWRVYDRTANMLLMYNGSAWAEFSGGGGGGGGVEEAPTDGTLYARKDGGWEAVPPSGGGSLTLANILPPPTSASSTAQASKGNVFVATRACDLYGVRCHMTEKNGATYRATLWTVVSGNLGTKVAETATWAGTADVERWKKVLFTTPYTLVANTTYVVLVTAESEAGSYAFPLYGGTSTSYYTALPIQHSSFGRIASAAIASGNAVSTGSGNYHVDLIGDADWAA